MRMATLLILYLVTLQFAFPSVANAAERGVLLRNTCPNPAGTMSGFRTREVVLKHGDKGGCPGDATARHSAPYWERSEIASTDFRRGPTYRFSVEIQFDPETQSSNGTTFFQVHQHSSGCGRCYPAVMVKANANGSITVDLLGANGYHRSHLLGVSRQQIAGKWTRFDIEMGTVPGSLSDVHVAVNGDRKLSGNAWIEPNGAIFLKSGLYRPGSAGGRLPTDRLWLRNLRYEQISR